MGQAKFMTFSRRLKLWIKNIPYAKALLRALAIAFYKYSGRRPWSFGYSFYKYAYARDVIMERLNIFRQATLPAAYGTKLDERCVEYPWFFSRLKNTEQRILDAGSSLNHPELLNLSLWQGRQLHITTLADEGQPSASIKPVYVYEDLRAMSYPNEFFDAIVCISTLEHVGMDNTLLYTQDPDKKEQEVQAYLKAMDEMKRVLKEEGTLYLTLPYGAHRNLGWFQVFDEAMVNALVKRFSPRRSEILYYKYTNRQWNVARREDCAQGYYVDIHAGDRYNDDSPAASQCVVCLALTK